MTLSITSNSVRLPVPAHYMRAAEQKQVREMTHPTGRPAGDSRSADWIIDQSPILRHFLDIRDNYHVVDDLMMQVGDWTARNGDARARANAAYDLNNVLRFIDNVHARNWRGSQRRNGQIDGFSSNGYGTVDNSEASLLKAFSYNGYSVLRHLPT